MTDRTGEVIPQTKTLQDAEQVLTRYYGYQHFRPGQDTAISGILSGRDALCVMPTGSGKSICYQIPALLLPGVTLVISPLISLMKDQVTAMQNRGIPAVCLHSGLSIREFNEAAQQILQGKYRIVCVAPERLQSETFVQMCQQLQIAFVAVDEAHCISQWGQDFRPNYLKIPAFIRMLPKRPIIGGFTATATPKVYQDILQNLGLERPVEVKTGFDRPNLSFSVYNNPTDKDETLLGLVRDRFRQSGIVYCATRKTVESVCALLEEKGFPATRYHAGLEREERMRNQDDFLFDRKRVMVATNAFGMGIDKANVSYVIHYNMPKSLEAYYQEAGRAGRDGCDADCILLYSGQDVILGRWLIEHTEPNPDLTPEQQKLVREQDEERLRTMTFYATSTRCFRQNILRYFGERAPDHCGNCSNCVPDCEHLDITTEAQMILSSIVRTRQQLSEKQIIDLLLGSVPYDLPGDVMDDIQSSRLTTFGLMKKRKEEQIQDELDALCDQGYLDRAEEDSRILRLNDRSREILFEKRRVTMRRIQRKNAQTVHTDLFQALQRLRYEISAREYIAAATLFPDGTLLEICQKLPKNKQELSRIEGMGVFKANRYGDQILELVDRFGRGRRSGKTEPAKDRLPSSAKQDAAGQTSSSRSGAVGQPPSMPPAADVQPSSNGREAAGQPWTEEEDWRLTQEFRHQMDLKDIARAHQRSRGAILSRLKKLNLV